MKLKGFDLQGSGKALRVHLLIGDDAQPADKGQWLESTVEVKIKGVMDVEAIQRAAMSRLRDELDAQLRELPKGGMN